MCRKECGAGGFTAEGREECCGEVKVNSEREAQISGCRAGPAGRERAVEAATVAGVTRCAGLLPDLR